MGCQHLAVALAILGDGFQMDRLDVAEEIGLQSVGLWIKDQRLKIVAVWRDGVDFKFTAKLFSFSSS